MHIKRLINSKLTYISLGFILVPLLEDKMEIKEHKKKKQHYVPQCYLERWAIAGTHQINVYDKNKQQSRINNIEDVA